MNNLENPFILANHEYQRDLNIVKKYINDSSFFLHKMKGIDVERAKTLVNKVISPKGKKPLVNPKMLILERNKTGDKFQKEITYMDFLQDIHTHQRICSPSMTVYLNPNEKTSVISEFLVKNMQKRKEVKKRGQAAEMAGDKVLASYCYNLQTAIKIINNSISGAHGSAGTPLYNHSAHPSLTSFGRCPTSYANANNERFLEGMRHYWCYESMQTDLISIVANSDYNNIRKIIDKYDLLLPETEDVINVIKRSTNQYWKSKEALQKIENLVEKLAPLERAAYLYTQDCHSLYTLNPEIVSKIIMEFTHIDKIGIDDPDVWIAKLDDDVLMTVSIIATNYLDGKNLTTLKETDYESYKKFAGTVKLFLTTREKYSDLFSTFWRTEHIPASIAVYPSAIRKTVIVSDTDSTIFTVANWVERIYGELDFGDIGKSIAAVMVYLASQTLKHVLAIYSVNMGVVKDRIFQLTMKNELIMESLMLTTKSKHYAYRVIAKEGNVYSNPKLDLKGVSLRNSKVPKMVREELKSVINDIFDDIKNEGDVSIIKYLTRVGDLERNIYKQIKMGSSDYLTRVKLRDKDSYRIPMSSNYYYYELWQNVFAPTYGGFTIIPAGTVKVSLKFSNITGFKEWLATIEDKALLERLEEFLKLTKRKFLTTILVPLEIAMRDGIPEVILYATDIRKIIYTSTEGFYLILESLGYFCNNRYHSRLIMDNY